MTPASVVTLPDGRRRGVCWLCGQHLSDTTTRPYIIPLTDPDAVKTFELCHDLDRVVGP